MLIKEQDLRRITRQRIKLLGKQQRLDPLLSENLGVAGLSNLLFTWIGKKAGFIPEDDPDMITDPHTWLQLNLALLNVVDPTAAPKKIGAPVPGVTDWLSSLAYVANDDPESAALVLALGAGMKHFGQWRAIRQSNKLEAGLKQLDELDPAYANKVRQQMNAMDAIQDASKWRQMMKKLDTQLVQTRIKARQQAFKIVNKAQQKAAQEYTDLIQKLIRGDIGTKGLKNLKHRVYLPKQGSSKFIDESFDAVIKNTELVTDRITDMIQMLSTKEGATYWARAINKFKRNYEKVVPEGTYIDPESFANTMDIQYRLNAWRLANKSWESSLTRKASKSKGAKKNLFLKLRKFLKRKAGKSLDNAEITPQQLMKSWDRFISEGRIKINFMLDKNKWSDLKEGWNTLGGSATRKTKPNNLVKISAINTESLEISINMLNPMLYGGRATAYIDNVFSHEILHIVDNYAGISARSGIEFLSPHMKEFDEMFAILKNAEKSVYTAKDEIPLSIFGLPKGAPAGYFEDPIEVWVNVNRTKAFLKRLGKNPNEPSSWKWLLHDYSFKNAAKDDFEFLEAERLKKLLEHAWFKSNPKEKSKIVNWLINFGKSDIPPPKNYFKVLKKNVRLPIGQGAALIKNASYDSKGNVRRDQRGNPICKPGYRWDTRKCIPKKRR